MTDRNELRAEIEIDAEPARVWAVLMDFEAYPDWNPFITSIQGERTVGARLRARLQPAGGRGITMSPSVTVNEPGTAFGWLGKLGCAAPVRRCAPVRAAADRRGDPDPVRAVGAVPRDPAAARPSEHPAGAPWRIRGHEPGPGRAGGRGEGLRRVSALGAETRLSPRRREIVEAARQILERDGESALTMRRLAADLGMKAPSLYKHFPDKESLELELIIVGFEESAAAFEAALATQPRSQIAALGAAYRAYARAHPHIYRLMTDRPLPRERLPVGLEYRAAAPLTQAMGSIAGARAAWALAHGLVMLEINGRFPADADIDAAWEAGITALERLRQT